MSPPFYFLIDLSVLRQPLSVRERREDRGGTEIELLSKLRYVIM